MAGVTVLMAIGASQAAATQTGAQPELPADAREEAANERTVGTIVVAHGGSAAWNAPVLEIAERTSTGGPVEVSFLMGDAAKEYRFQDAAARLIARGAERIVVVPLLASSHSGHYAQIRYLAGEMAELDERMMEHLVMAGIERPDLDRPIDLTPALDASMEIATVVAERALNLADRPAEQALFIVGHGPNAAEANAEWMRNLRPVADSVARLTGFRDVKLGLVRDDAPDPVREEAVRRIREIIRLQHALTDRVVVVVPVLISKGYVSTRKLPADLENLPVAYDAEGLLPHPQVASWIARRVREATSENGAAADRSTAAKEPRDVVVRMSDFAFTTSDSVFVAGVPYRFVLENQGQVAHEWAVVPRGAEDERNLLFEVEEEDLPPGAEVAAEFTFAEAGEYDFACYIPGHYPAGMVLPVRVLPASARDRTATR